MMRARSGTRLGLAALTGAVGVLSLLTAYLFLTPIDTSPIAPPADKAEAQSLARAELATALDKKTPDQFRETVGRPLFNPTRKPVERAQVAAGRPKAEPVDLRLIGIMKVPNGPPRALLRSADEPTGKWIAEGAEIAGWRLKKIDDRSVVVQSGARSEELILSPTRRPPEER
jgi:hypothetical protein